MREEKPRTREPVRSWPAVSVLVLGTLSSSIAAAEPTRDPLAAEAEFADARALIAQDRWAEACPKLESSLALDPAVGTLLNLAECYARVGKTASAWLRYRETAALARQNGQSDREAFARAKAKGLEPRLCRLVIVAPERSVVVVRRDGIETALRTPVPVDPGEHEIVAEASGRATFRTAVTVAAPEGGSACRETRVAIPESASEETPLATPAPMPSLDAGPKVPAARGGGLRTQHVLAIGAAGLAVVGVAVGTAFGLDAASTNRDADAECSPRCTDRGRDLKDDAGVSADIATGAFIAAGAFLTAAVVLWLTAPSTSTVARRGPVLSF